MLDEVRFIEVEPRPLAVVRRRASFAELGATVMQALDIVLPFLREHDVPTGHNVILYHDQLMNLEAGVEVFAGLPPHDEVVASSTPAGRVATVAYWGSYDELSLAHTAIARQCIADGLKLDGRNWEVYGDWTDDPEQLRTDVFYLLRD
jgi:effector-binding domain-containing protein